jgi:hypothetical protein
MKAWEVGGQVRELYSKSLWGGSARMAPKRHDVNCIKRKARL